MSGYGPRSQFISEIRSHILPKMLLFCVGSHSEGQVYSCALKGGATQDRKEDESKQF